MTKAEFIALPMLLLEYQVIEATGYSPTTLRKLVDCGVLEKVRGPNGGWGRYRKLQVAKLAGIPPAEVIEQWRALTQTRPLLMGEKEVTRITGLAWRALPGMFTQIRPAGSAEAKYRVEEIAAFCGIETHQRGTKAAKVAPNPAARIDGEKV